MSIKPEGDKDPIIGIRASIMQAFLLQVVNDVAEDMRHKCFISAVDHFGLYIETQHQEITALRKKLEENKPLYYEEVISSDA